MAKKSKPKPFANLDRKAQAFRKSHEATRRHVTEAAKSGSNKSLDRYLKRSVFDSPKKSK